jgi:hypothetical protein
LASSFHSGWNTIRFRCSGTGSRTWWRWRWWRWWWRTIWSGSASRSSRSSQLIWSD